MINEANPTKVIKRPILLSTGVLRIPFESEENYPQKIINIYRSRQDIISQIDGLELNIRSSKILDTMHLDDNTLDFAKSLSHNTLHFIYFEKISLQKITPIYSKLKEFQDAFKFKNMVLHPNDYSTQEIQEIYSFFKELGIQRMNVENMIHEEMTPLKDFEHMVNSPFLGFVLDITHATIAEIDQHKYNFNYLNQFQNKLAYLHMSSTCRVKPYTDKDGKIWNYKMHMPFSKSTQEDLSIFEHFIERMISTNPKAAMVLETSLKKIDLESIANDLKYLRQKYAGAKNE
jgi:hypothetical protein